MTAAFVWGLIAASSLIVGGLIAGTIPLGRRTLGAIMGFGAGVLISAVAFELVFEAVHAAKFTGLPALGFFAGAFVFFFSDLLISRRSDRKVEDVLGVGELEVSQVGGPTKYEATAHTDAVIIWRSGEQE